MKEQLIKITKEIYSELTELMESEYKWTNEQILTYLDGADNTHFKFINVLLENKVISKKEFNEICDTDLRHKNELSLLMIENEKKKESDVSRITKKDQQKIKEMIDKDIYGSIDMFTYDGMTFGDVMLFIQNNYTISHHNYFINDSVAIHVFIHNDNAYYLRYDPYHQSIRLTINGNSKRQREFGDFY